MKWTEITLNGIQPLFFDGKRIGTVERQETSNRINDLAIALDTGAHADLRSAVDVAERLHFPRLFVVEGSPRDTFLLVGGENAYWLTPAGTVRTEYPLFRIRGEEEFWTTQILEYGNGLVIIYEAGVLAIDEALQVRCHKRKLLNDHFVVLEGNSLKLVRDHSVEWAMRLENGGSSGN